MDKSTTHKKNKFWLFALMGVAVIGIITVAGIIASAAGGPYVQKEGTTYTAHVSTADVPVDQWKYVIRANSTCNSGVFDVGTAYNGNLTNIVVGSNTYTPTANEISRYDGAYICFSARIAKTKTTKNFPRFEYFGIQMRASDESGSYQPGHPEQPVTISADWDNWSVSQKIASNPYRCPAPVIIMADSGRCVLNRATPGAIEANAAGRNAPDRDDPAISSSITNNILAIKVSDAGSDIKSAVYFRSDRCDGLTSLTNRRAGVINFTATKTAEIRIPSNIARQSIKTICVIATDNADNVAYRLVSMTEPTTSGGGDDAGGASSSSSGDTTPPVIVTSLRGNTVTASTTASDVNTNSWRHFITATNPVCSTSADSLYSSRGTTVTLTSQQRQTIQYVCFKVSDTTGNVSYAKRAVPALSATPPPDTTPPNIYSQIANNVATVRVSDAGSGIKSAVYFRSARCDSSTSGAGVNFTATKTARIRIPSNVSGQSIKTICVIATDNAGNVTYRLVSMTAAERFDDLEATDYYAEAVGGLVNAGVAAACYEDSFCPDQIITRGQFITWLYRAAGQPKPSRKGSAIFEDIAAGSTADKAAGWAHQHGITTGCRTGANGNAFFCPNTPVQRAHMATFLHRLAGQPAAKWTNTTIKRLDVDSAAYYTKAADWAFSYRLVTACGEDGAPDNPVIGYTFCPNRSVDRGEAAFSIWKAASGSWAKSSATSNDTNSIFT